MKFEELLRVTAHEPVFDTGLLLAGAADPGDVRRQVTRWAGAGRLLQLRRGLYALAPPYHAVEAHPFLVANRLDLGSYVSCQSALAHFGLIPEGLQSVTSVGPRRPGVRETPLGRFEVRHLGASLRWGFQRLEVALGQEAFVATPEKALLDLVYLTPGGDSPDFLRELRLQNLDRLDLAELARQAERSGKPKLRRAAEVVTTLAREEALEYVAV